MDDQYIDDSLERLRALRLEASKKAEQYSQIRTELQSVNVRVENLERFLAAEIHSTGNKHLKQELDAILNEKVPMPESKPKSDSELSKTSFLALILYKANVTGRGLTTKELAELAFEADSSFEDWLSYAHNVMYKLRKRGHIEKKGELNFLTDQGREFYGQFLT